MPTAARNPSTAQAAPRRQARTVGAARPAPVEAKAPRWTETRAIAAMARSFA
jgi:hypothetical protein